MNILPRMVAKIITLSTVGYAYGRERKTGDWMNPKTFRHREYAALACLAIGGLLALVGVASLILSAQSGLAGLFFGTAAIGTGVAALAAAPDPTTRD